MSNHNKSLQTVDDLLTDMRIIRDSNKDFFWNQEQTMEAIFPYSLEEMYELGEAIDQQDNHAICEELGDVLLQLIIYAQIAELHNNFSFYDICHGIHQKIIRRHPHIFANEHYETREQQKKAWNTIKQSEKNNDNTKATTSFTDIASTLTALQRGQKVLDRVAEEGFDWDSWQPVVEKVREELDEIIDAIDAKESHKRIEEEVGDLFVACINLARHLQINAENATRKANKKFETRYDAMRIMVKKLYPEQEHFTLEQMDHAWEQVKSHEQSFK